MARGGKREGAGRPRGQRSAATKDQIAGISELARMHSETALAALVQIASKGTSESARVSAANSILDRAFGKPLQALEMTGLDGGPIQHEATLNDDLRQALDAIAGKLAGGTDADEVAGDSPSDAGGASR